MNSSDPLVSQPALEEVPALTRAARRRGLIVLLASNFLMFGGFFMVVPLIAVHYVDKLGWAASAIGAVLGLRQMLQQGLTLFGGALADRLGAKPLIAIGLFIRVLGFGGMAWADTLPLLLLSAILAAVGGAFFDAPSAAAIAALTDEQNRSHYYSLRGVLGSLGMTLGPLSGALLLRVDFGLVCLVAAFCFFLTLLITLGFLPAVQVATERHDLLYGIRLASRNTPFVLFTALSMGFWLMWVQITISLPLVARELSGTDDAVSWIYALNSGLTVLLQYPLIQLAQRRLSALQLVILGSSLMAFGLGGVALAGSLLALMGCVILYAFGAMLVTPMLQTVTANLAGRDALGSYFGVSALALAFGGGIGNLIGGTLYELGRNAGWPALPWVSFCLIGLGCAIGMIVLLSRQRAAHQSSASV